MLNMSLTTEYCKLLLKYCNENNSNNLKFYTNIPSITTENYIVINNISNGKKATVYGTVKEITTNMTLIMNQDSGYMSFEIINSIVKTFEAMQDCNFITNFVDENLGVIQSLEIAYNKLTFSDKSRIIEYENLSKQDIKLISGIRLIQNNDS